MNTIWSWFIQQDWELISHVEILFAERSRLVSLGVVKLFVFDNFLPIDSINFYRNQSKIVNAVWFWFNSTRFRVDFSSWEFFLIYLISFAERSRLVSLGVINFLFLFIYSGLEFTLTFVTHIQHGFGRMDQVCMPRGLRGGWTGWGGVSGNITALSYWGV